jgi:hypothetical protein
MRRKDTSDSTEPCETQSGCCINLLQFAVDTGRPSSELEDSGNHISLLRHLQTANYTQNT